MNALKFERFSLAELQALPTLCDSHFDDLKIDKPAIRVWLSRCGIADGLLHDNGVMVEVLDPKTGKWVIVDAYEAK